MGNFIVQNLSETPISVAIEPWAQADTLQPGSTAEFAYDDEPEPAIEFCYGGEKEVTVSIVARNIVIAINGRRLTYDWLDWPKSPATD